MKPIITNLFSRKDVAITNAEESTRFWVEEGRRGVLRQTAIHLNDCPLCIEGSRNRLSDSNKQWYGPFESLSSAREVSDKLAEVAIRSECRCVRRVLPQEISKLALLNEPLFQKPDTIEIGKRKEKSEQNPKSSPKSSKLKKPQYQRAKRYAVLALTLVVVIAAVLFAFPAISVVEASVKESPFRIANTIPIPLTHVSVECLAQIPETSVPLQQVHTQVTELLQSEGRVPIPCFQMTGESVPQTSGMTMQMAVSYGVLGVRHAKQNFVFVAARTPNGYCRWVLKG